MVLRRRSLAAIGVSLPDLGFKSMGKLILEAYIVSDDISLLLNFFPSAGFFIIFYTYQRCYIGFGWITSVCPDNMLDNTFEPLILASTTTVQIGMSFNQNDDLFLHAIVNHY